MKEAFVDTFFWLALVNPRDAHHQAALAFPRPPRLVTTVPVLIEVMDALSAPTLRAATGRFWTEVTSSPDLTILPLTEPLLAAGVALPDHHFEQAGFRALLKAP